MLFRKKMPRACAYCVHGARLEDGQILCTKKGLRTEEQKCFRFRYDACKRIPVRRKALDLSAWQDQDFSL